MNNSRFFWRRAFPSLLLVSSFVLLYESTVSDSRYAARQAELLEGELKPAPGTRLQFEATAYCKGQTTASGVGVRSGVAAADHRNAVSSPHAGRHRRRRAAVTAAAETAASAIARANRGAAAKSDVRET